VDLPLEIRNFYRDSLKKGWQPMNDEVAGKIVTLFY
jgi:hypothetical protein